MLKNDREGELKRSENESAKSVKYAAPNSEPDSDSCPYCILIENKIDSVVLGDYDAEVSAMLAATFNEAQAVEKNLEVTTLNTPSQFECAFKSHDDERTLTFKSRRSVKLCITVTLPGCNIP